MLKIVLVPDPILTKSVKPVTVFDPSLKKLISDMKESLDAQTDPQGVGLAAPQVGIPLAAFIIKPTLNGSHEAFINAKILKRISPRPRKTSSKKRRHTKLEGCLSIPKIWGPVKRDTRILLEYQTVEGEKKQQWFGGFKSIIIQHEVDHLNGILFTQRALEQKHHLYEEIKGKLEKMSNY